MNMNTLIDIITRDIVILLFLVVVVLLLYEYAVYSEIKKHAYKVTCKVTCRQALRLHILALKIASRPVIIPGLRMYLLFLVTGFPLTLISISTNFSILLVMVSLLGKVWSPFPVSTEIIISFLFLLANIIVMHYFLGEYGSIYKLLIMFFIRDDVRQLLKKHQTVYKTGRKIVAGSILSFGMYIITVMINLQFILTLPSSFPSVLLKISGSIVMALLTGYILFNKKYENAIELIEKIWSIWKCGGERNE